MSGKNVNFGNKKIKKGDFYKNKKVAKIDDIDVNKILVSLCLRSIVFSFGSGHL